MVIIQALAWRPTTLRGSTPATPRNLPTDPAHPVLSPASRHDRLRPRTLTFDISGLGFLTHKASGRHQFQNRLPPRLMGCLTPGAEAVPLLIWTASCFRSSSLSSSEDGARGFDFLMGRTGDESVSDGGVWATLRLRAPPERGEASLDGVGDRMRISGCRSALAAPGPGVGLEGWIEGSSSGSVAEPESAAWLIELGLHKSAMFSLFELDGTSRRSLAFD